MAEVYYDRATRTAVPSPAYDPLNPMHIELDPSHIFFQPMPEGQEFTYDLNDVPNGYQNLPQDNAYLIRQDLIAANITLPRLTIELFKNAQALPSDLASIYTEIQTIALNHATTEGAVLNALG